MVTNFEQQIKEAKHTLVNPFADRHLCSAVCALLACWSVQVTASASGFSHEASPRTY